MLKKISILILLVALSLQVSGREKEARLMRFPTIANNTVVFSYAGDLYKVSAEGGVASKLTNGEGYEMFAHFSPNGNSIAFTAQYDGNTEVYTMPISGGEPKRLTYTATLDRDDISDRMGPNNIVMGWRDNESVVYRTRHKSFDAFKGRLCIASTKGGLSEELPLPTGGFCSYAPDGKKLAYNQVFREFRTWKYYRGGMADDVWVYDFASKKVEKISDNIHQNMFPMWTGNIIYYLSDRDRIMNMFAYDTQTKVTKKITTFDRYDIKFPTLGDKYIVFENGGYIYKFDLATQKSEKLTIYINDDMVGGREQLKNVSRNIAGADISPNGQRIALSARGDVFTVPVSSGITRNLTNSSAVHDRNVNWSPDGKWIGYISDATGEDEIYIRAQDGSGEPVQVTKNSDTYKYGFSWSPDSKKIMWSDQMNRLRFVEVATKRITEIEHTLDGELKDFEWSPDSRWVVYSMPRFQTTRTICIYDVTTGKKEIICDEWFDSSSPSFSNDGKYLTFVSSREFNPTYSRTEWNHSMTDMENVYIVPLKHDTPSPFAYVNNEQEDKKEDNKDKKSDAVTVAIDFGGIKERALALSTPAGSYGSPLCIDDMVYYTRRGATSSSLYMYNLKEEKETDLGQHYIYGVTSDYKKFLVRSSGQFAVIDTPKAPIKIDKTIDLSNLNVITNLREEWKQIFNESWRQMRDFFYDPNMHGVDWKDIHTKYAPLVEYVNDRNDLNYIIGEMIGELNCGHAYVGDGDRVQPKRVKTGLLGAELSRHSSGYYKIDRILEGRNWTKELRSPLTEIGVDAKQGEYIVSVNGVSTKEMVDIYATLYNTVDKQVELELNANPSQTGARKVIVMPIANESPLYYLNWVHDNIAKVEKATNGKVGYIHIPDMGVDGLKEFVKYFYPQLNKSALIIDDRGNGGGNVSPMIIERLRRELAMMAIARNGRSNPKPSEMMPGPKVLLMDKYSASDGDLFPYQFKHYGLGKLVGERTWGGVVGIRGSLPFIDGGTLTRPEFAHFDAKGKEFIIEGWGVDPDVHVVNDPAKEYAGEDQQLTKAIEMMLEELKRNPVSYPTAPAFPNKSK